MRGRFAEIGEPRFRRLQAIIGGHHLKSCGGDSEAWEGVVAELSSGESDRKRRWLGPHAPRLAAEAVPHWALSADQAAPEPCSMRNAVVVSLNLDANAAAPHRAAAVQAGDRCLERQAQTSHGVIGVDPNRVPAVRIRIEGANHGFEGGIVRRGHVGVLGGSAATIAATRGDLGGGAALNAT